MLVPDRLTEKMTVKVCGAAASALRINCLEGLLMIEWEWPSRSIGVYRDLLRRPSRHLISAMAQCSDVNGTSGKVHLHCAANFAVSSNFRDWLERLRSDWARLWGPRRIDQCLACFRLAPERCGGSLVAPEPGLGHWRTSVVTAYCTITVDVLSFCSNVRQSRPRTHRGRRRSRVSA